MRDLEFPLQLKPFEEEYNERYSESFEANVRYLASSLIVTIPVKVTRELGIKLGDRVLINIQKSKASPHQSFKDLYDLHEDL